MEITHWCKITADLVISLALGQLNTLTWDILTISDNTHYGCHGDKCDICDNIIKSDQNQSEPVAIQARDMKRDYLTIPACGGLISGDTLLLVEQWHHMEFLPVLRPGPTHLRPQPQSSNPPGLQVCKGVTSKETREQILLESSLWIVSGWGQTFRQSCSQVILILLTVLAKSDVGCSALNCAQHLNPPRTHYLWQLLTPNTHTCSGTQFCSGDKQRTLFCPLFLVLSSRPPRPGCDSSDHFPWQYKVAVSSKIPLSWWFTLISCCSIDNILTRNN